MPLYICTDCNKEFNHKGTYNRHIAKVKSCKNLTREEEIRLAVKQEVKKEVKNIMKKQLKAPLKMSELRKLKAQQIVQSDDDFDNLETKSDSESNISSDSKLDDANMEIATKEDLKEKIHEIHNFLRNNGVGYGMNALKVFNLFYGLARVEEKNLYKHIDLNPECKFSTLLDIVERNDSNSLFTKVDEFQTMLTESTVEQYILFELPGSIKYDTLSHLIREVDYLIKTEKKLNMQLVGKLYEYFVGRDKSAISEMGAYFTDRHIVDFIYNNVLDVHLDEKNHVYPMIDPFGGSGGFTIGYIRYLNEKYNIDWSQNLDNIYHFDMNDDVVKYAGLEFMCLTQYPPKMNHNLRCLNTFTHEFEKKYKYVITNPPYGGDKRMKSAKWQSREKIRTKLLEQIANLNEDNDEELIDKKQQQLSYLKRMDKLEVTNFNKTKVSVANSSQFIQQYASKHNLDGNDKESVSLILMMCLLEQDGTAVGVLKEGVFFDKKYSKIRKHLLENFNVSNVYSVDAKQFENTSTKTSIIKFTNDGKTKRINFHDIKVNRYEEDLFEEDKNGDLFISHIKDEIKDITTDLVSTATLKQVKATGSYSLNAKDYSIVEEIEVPEGYKLVKLGDVCVFLPKSKRKASYGKDEGKYPFYTSSNNVKYCDVADYNQLAIIIGTHGDGSIHISNNFSCTNNNLIMTCENPIISNYLYHYIKSNFRQIISDVMRGSIIKAITPKQLKNVQIVIPENEQELKNIVNQIMESYNAKIQTESKLANLEIKVKTRITEIHQTEECNKYKLSDICNIKTGKNRTPDNKKGTLYPYYGTSNITGYTDHYLYDGEYVLIARNGTIGNCFLVNGKFYPSDHIFILINEKNIIDNYLLYYSMQLSKSALQDMSSGSIIDGIKKDDVMKIQIKTPKNREVLNELQNYFNEIKQLKQTVQEKETEYNTTVNRINVRLSKSILS